MTKANRKAQRASATGGLDVLRKPTRRREFLQMVNQAMSWCLP